jgi:integrase
VFVMDEKIKLLQFITLRSGVQFPPSLRRLAGLSGVNDEIHPQKVRPKVRQNSVVVLPYKNVKIMTMNNDLTKRWHVQYYYYNSENEKFERKRLYLDVNREKTISARLALLKQIKKALYALFDLGFNPYEYFDENRIGGENNFYTLVDAIDFVLKNQETTLKPNTVNSSKYVYQIFKTWCIGQGFNYIQPKDFTKKNALDFLNQEQKRRGLSNRTRNNYRTYIHALFTKFAEHDLVEINPITYVAKLPEKSEKNKVYTNKQVSHIADFMKTHEPQLYLLLLFIMYAFVRIESAIKIQIKHIDLDAKRFLVPAQNEKTGVLIHKPLFGTLLQVLHGVNLSQHPQEHYLFNTQSQGLILPSETMPNRDYFSKRFLKQIKRPLKMGAEYTLYGFRHTAACNLYTNLRKEMSKDEAESRLMAITGHQTKDALRKYLREIGAEMPDDYSKYYTIDV